MWEELEVILVKIGRTIIRGGRVFGIVNRFALANLFSQYRGTLPVRLLGMVLQLT
jgi:hypothetical protein